MCMCGVGHTKIGVCVAPCFFFVVLGMKGIQRENKHGDTIFLAPFFSVLCMNINYAKFGCQVWLSG